MDTLPGNVYIYKTLFTEQIVAACRTCSFLCAYWEDRDELSHDCNDH